MMYFKFVWGKLNSQNIYITKSLFNHPKIQHQSNNKNLKLLSFIKRMRRMVELSLNYKTTDTAYATNQINKFKMCV